MPKKKKKSLRRNDTRGYSTTGGRSVIANSNSANLNSATATPGTKKQDAFQVGKSTRSVQVTAQAYSELMELMDELKKSMYDEHKRNGGDHDHDDNAEEKNNNVERKKCYSVIGNVSNDDKRLVKKVAFLNDNLKQLGFHEEQIKQVLIALICGHGRTVRQLNEHKRSQHHTTNSNRSNIVNNVNIFSLDDALDWLCLNISSDELPKLFTDINHRGQDNQEMNLDVIKVGFQEFQIKEGDGEEDGSKNNDFTANVVHREGTDREESFFSLQRKEMESSNKKETKDEAVSDVKNTNNEAATRMWLLSQYQYDAAADDDDGDGEEVNEGADDKTADTANQQNIYQEGNQAKENDENTEEIRPKFPEEIRLERLEKEAEELRADVNNEANNYMRSKHEIAGLKKRLKTMDNQAKKLRSKISKMIDVYESTKVDRCNDQEKERGGNNYEKEEKEEEDDEGYGIGLFDITVKSNTLETEPLVKKINYIEVEIPQGWSGKIPKQMLLEHCRKNKWPKPSFSRMENSTNGCIIKLKKHPLHDATIHAEEGPFRTMDDAENYTSTKVLYALHPNLQMYLMMPPSFRDLWMNWLKENQEKEDEVRSSIENKRREEISNLISYLGSVVDTNATNISSSDDVVGYEKPTIDNWDDESLDSDHNNSLDYMNSHSTQQSTQVVSLTRMGENLKRKFTERQMEKGYQRMFKTRKSLPIYSFRQDILDSVRENAVTVLCAETGAGKTTQCPQYILEEALLSGSGDKANIICTQPRRISALSVAERVADEMDDNVGNQVGYHIRMEAKKSKHTKLLFCTTGVVLRRLYDDPNLNGVTHVIVDEVHERQWEIDFLLIALRKLLNTTRKTDLKVILMSATLDSKLFCSFFQGAPFLSIPGRTFPVSEYYLEDVIDATDHFIEEDSKYAIKECYDARKETLMVTNRGGEKRRETVYLDNEAEVIEISDDYIGYKISTRRSMDRVDEEVLNYDLIEDLLTLLLIEKNKHTSILPPGSETPSDSSLSNGSILIFLPGMGEIQTLHDRLKGSKSFSNPNRFDIIPMHSTLSPKDQKRAFMTPKLGCQKIIIATNIAETSITIDDCVCVIDSGLVREVIQDKRSSTSKLITAWCSRASSKQRAGRAGRVQPGICCKLYSSKTSKNMKKQSIPELQRIPLEEICLTILGANLASNCMDFLMQAPEPPSNDAVSNALKVLEEVDAIEPLTSSHDGTRLEIITPLGEHLAKLPVHIRLGKMLIFGALFKVLDKTLTIAASLSSKSPFLTNIDNSHQASAAHKAFAHPTSDFLTVCNVWDAYRAACEISSSNGRRFCEKNYLNRTAFIEIEETRMQFIQLLAQIGFIDASHLESTKTISTTHYNKYASNENILSAVICAGLYPNCAHVLRGSKSKEDPPTIWHKKDQLWFHKSSVLHDKKKIDSDWIIYHEKFATHKVFVSTTSLVKPFSLLLFGKSVDIKFLDRKVVVDDWIELKLPAQTGVMFRELREEMSNVLGSKIKCLGGEEPKGEAFIEKVTRLLMLEF